MRVPSAFEKDHFLRRLKQCVYIHTVHRFKENNWNKQSTLINVYIYITYPHNCTHVCQASLSPYRVCKSFICWFQLSSFRVALSLSSRNFTLCCSIVSASLPPAFRVDRYGVTRGNGQKYMGNWSCNLYKYSFIAITLLLTGRCPPCINILLNKLTELNWAISTLVLRSNHVWFGTHKPRLKRKRLSLATKSTTRQLE